MGNLVKLQGDEYLECVLDLKDVCFLSQYQIKEIRTLAKSKITDGLNKYKNYSFYMSNYNLIYLGNKLNLKSVEIIIVLKNKDNLDIQKRIRFVVYQNILFIK